MYCLPWCRMTRTQATTLLPPEVWGIILEYLQTSNLKDFVHLRRVCKSVHIAYWNCTNMFRRVWFTVDGFVQFPRRHLVTKLVLNRQLTRPMLQQLRIHKQHIRTVSLSNTTWIWLCLNNMGALFSCVEELYIWMGTSSVAWEEQRNTSFPLLEHGIYTQNVAWSGGSLVSSLAPRVDMPQVINLSLRGIALQSLFLLQTMNIKKLVRLDISDNDIATIKELEQLQHLQYLYMHKNKICNFTPIASLTQLRVLVMARNYCAHDLSFLSGMHHLCELNLSNNPLQPDKCRILTTVAPQLRYLNIAETALVADSSLMHELCARMNTQTLLITIPYGEQYHERNFS